VPVERYYYEPYITAARSQIDEASWMAAWAEGRAMTPEQAIEHALDQPQDPERTGAPAYPAGLSAREVEVLRLAASGLTNADIARDLFISPRTVNAHLGSVYHKIGSSTRAEAARFAQKHHLL
jgi:DNA-binding CsgD family transcriptional regulator